MLLSLRADHKEHLRFLSSQSIDVIVRFCKLARDFLHHGPNENLHELAAEELQIDKDTVQHCIYGLLNLVLLACKHKLSEADFRDSILTLDFQSEKQSVLYEFYKTRTNEIQSVLESRALQDDHYSNMEWRFEVQISSRCLKQQVNPLLTIELSLQSGCDGKPRNLLLQTDPTNLVNITNKLKAALTESRSTYARKIQNALSTS